MGWPVKINVLHFPQRFTFESVGGTNRADWQPNLRWCFCVFWQTYVIDGLVDGRLMQKWHAKTSRYKLPFVRINDELRRQTSWPPPSQLGGSLVDIMKLENSFFQAEQAEEELLPTSESRDIVADVSGGWPQTELINVNDIVTKNESCFSTAEICGLPINLETMSAVNSGEPRPFDGTVL